MDFRKLGSQPDGVESVTFLADGDWLATGDRGATIHLWPVTADASQDNSMSPRKIMPYWIAHEDRIQALAVSTGSNLLVSGGLDGVINMWTPNPQSAEWKIATPGLNARDMAIGKNGQLYLADKDIIQYDFARREGTSAFSTQQPRWMSIATSNDGRRMAATDHKTLSMFDLDSQQLIQSWPISPELDDPQMAVSPDGQKVATAWWSSVDYVEIYDVERPDEILRFPATQSHAIDFSPDGDRLAYGSMNDLVVRNIAHDKELFRLTEHSSTLADCAYHPSGDLIATVGHDRHLKLWNAHNGKKLYSVIAHGDKVKSVAFSPDGKTIVTGGRDQVVKLWDCQTGQPLFDFGTEADGIDDVQFTPDGQRLVCLLGNGTIIVYDISRPADKDT